MRVFLLLFVCVMTSFAEGSPRSLSQDDQEMVAALEELKKEGDAKQQALKDREVEQVLQFVKDLFPEDERCISFVGMVDADPKIFELNLGGFSLDHGQTYDVLKRLVLEDRDTLWRRKNGVTVFDLLIQQRQWKLLEALLTELNARACFLPLETCETMRYLIELQQDGKRVSEEESRRLNGLLSIHARARLKELTLPLGVDAPSVKVWVLRTRCLMPKNSPSGP